MEAISAVDKLWKQHFPSSTSHPPERVMTNTDRAALTFPVGNLSYGEIDFHTIALVLSRHVDFSTLPQYPTFFDLGSGTGRAALSVACCHDFSKIIGIEFVTNLCAVSRERAERFQSRFAPELRALLSKGIDREPPNICPNISFLRSDFRDIEWSTGDVVLAVATCFDASFLLHIASHAATMKPGSYLITTTHRLNLPPPWVITEAPAAYTGSWGSVTFVIHYRAKAIGDSTPTVCQEAADANTDLPERKSEGKSEMPLSMTEREFGEMLLNAASAGQEREVYYPITTTSTPYSNHNRPEARLCGRDR